MAKYKVKLFFLFFALLFSFASTMLIVFNYNPYEIGAQVFSIFYLSLFATIAGILTFIILFIKLRTPNKAVTVDIFWPSLRQGMLFSLIISVLLLLRGLKILDLWVGISLTVAIIMLELFFRSNNYKKTS